MNENYDYPPEWDEEDEDPEADEDLSEDEIDEEVLTDEAALEKAWQDAESAFETLMQQRGEGTGK